MPPDLKEYTIKSAGDMKYARQTVTVKRDGERTEVAPNNSVELTEAEAQSLREAGVVFEGEEDQSTEEESTPVETSRTDESDVDPTWQQTGT